MVCPTTAFATWDSTNSCVVLSFIVPGCLGVCPALTCTMESVSCSCAIGSDYNMSGLQGCGDVIFKDVEFEGFFVFFAL